MTDFNKTKAFFKIDSNLIYLDGNSLGPMPLNAQARARQTIEDEWGKQLILAWNKAGWMDLSAKIANRIAPLIGASDGTVMMGDTLSIKVYQALAACLSKQKGRKVILSDRGNFPTDLYMAQGLIDQLDQGHRIETPPPEAVEASIQAIGDDLAVLMLTHVDYRTGRMHDMHRLTQLAQSKGAMVIWDLAHSAGAVNLNIEASNAEFAAGCSYKYLNGGPGAPAFIYVRQDIIPKLAPVLSGWLGHQSPFDFDLDYLPASGIERMRIGTPSVIQLSILDAAMEVWQDMDMLALRRQSQKLTSLFIKLIGEQLPDLKLVSPIDPEARGSQVSYAFEEGYAVMQALIAAGVIGDFRAPNIMRFGFAPLYNDEDQVQRAVIILTKIMRERLWDRPEYKQKAKVT